MICKGLVGLYNKLMRGGDNKVNWLIVYLFFFREK